MFLLMSKIRPLTLGEIKTFILENKPKQGVAKELQRGYISGDGEIYEYKTLIGTPLAPSQFRAFFDLHLEKEGKFSELRIKPRPRGKDDYVEFIFDQYNSDKNRISLSTECFGFPEQIKDNDEFPNLDWIELSQSFKDSNKWSDTGIYYAESFYDATLAALKNIVR